MIICNDTNFWHFTYQTLDKIAVMEGGRCVECGTYDQLMEKKGAFYQYRQLQL